MSLLENPLYEGYLISSWLLERWCNYRKYVTTLKEYHLISVRIQSFKSVRWLEKCLQPVIFNFSLLKQNHGNKASFVRPSPHFRLIFGFWRIIMNRRFINSYITSQKFLLIILKDAQTLLRRNHMSPLLWSTVRKCGTHLADSFLVPKHSCKMYHTRPTEMFTLSLISRIFNQRSLSTMSWILSTISWEVTSFGWPGHSASLVIIRTQRNSVNHLWTMPCDGADSL